MIKGETHKKTSIILKSITFNSCAVSQMVDKRHDHLVRDIETYARQMSEASDPDSGGAEFFIESSYQDAQEKRQKHYLIKKRLQNDRQ